MAGTTSILCLGKETFETMRMKRQEIDQALLYAEDHIDKQGVPQIDFVMINENVNRWTSNVEIDDEATRKKDISQKFKRAIRRLVLLSRAAKKRGNENFNIGGLVFEITKEKTSTAEKAEVPTAWIEIVIGQLNMNEIISDEVLQVVNQQIQFIKERTKTQALVFDILKQEVQQIDFPELFKDATMLKKIYQIMTSEEKVRDTTFEAIDNGENNVLFP